jgi:hypothetical protein
MRLTYDGKLLVGRTTDDGTGALLQVAGSQSISGNSQVSNNFFTGSSAFVNGATSSYSGNASAMTVNYTGSGSQYGITMKPNASTSDTNAIGFLPSTATYASAAPIASIQHRSGDVGMNLSGSWTLNNWAVLSSNQPTINKPTIKGYIEQIQWLNPGATVTIDPTQGTLLEISTTANLTITLPAAVAGMAFTIIVLYGGSHAVTFAGGTNLKWAGGTAPASTSTAGKLDKYVFTCGANYTLAQDGGRNF